MNLEQAIITALQYENKLKVPEREAAAIESNRTNYGGTTGICRSACRSHPERGSKGIFLYVQKRQWPAGTTLDQFLFQLHRSTTAFLIILIKPFDFDFQ